MSQNETEREYVRRDVEITTRFLDALGEALAAQRERIRFQRLAKLVETGTAYTTAAVLLVAFGFLLASPVRPWFGFVAAGIAAGDLFVAMGGTICSEWLRGRAGKI